MLFAVVALLFQRLERFRCHLPAGAAASHEVLDVALAHPSVCPPPTVLDAVRPYCPVLDAIAPYGCGRLREGQGMAHAPPLPQPGSAGVSLVRGHAPAVLRGVALRAQRGMLPCVDTEDGVQPVRVQGLHGGSMRTQAGGGEHALEVGGFQV
jgi:hypothetical protein